MDRFDEFHRIVKIISQDSFRQDHRFYPSQRQTAIDRISRLLADSTELVTKLEKVSQQKQEFSNDRSSEVSDFAAKFQMITSEAKNRLSSLRLDEVNRLTKQSPQTVQHFKIIADTLSKDLTKKMQIFQTCLRQHSKQIADRQQRISKYGKVVVDSNSSTLNGFDSTQEFAMFSQDNSGALRQRKMLRENIQTHAVIDEAKYRPEIRLSNAQRIEATIAHMGEMFTQMAQLVMEQSETISRIEDDIEVGLQETIKANTSMQSFYEITKGNRGMVLKIFALLVLFIFIFLVWT